MGSRGTTRGQAGAAAHLLIMEINGSTLSGLEPLLSIEALAEYREVPVATIRDWRTDGKGPCAIRVGGRVRFAASDVLSWLPAQRESEPGRGPGGAVRVDG